MPDSLTSILAAFPPLVTHDDQEPSDDSLEALEAALLNCYLVAC